MRIFYSSNAGMFKKLDITEFSIIVVECFFPSVESP